jgi:hypothetical protein
MDVPYIVGLCIFLILEIFHYDYKIKDLMPEDYIA